jgi:hypothetical protein
MHPEENKNTKNSFANESGQKKVIRDFLGNNKSIIPTFTTIKKRKNKPKNEHH